MSYSQATVGHGAAALQIQGGEWQYNECLYCSEESHGDCAHAAAATGAAACL